MKESFDKGLRLKRERTYNNCALILTAMAALPEHGGTHAEILGKIREGIADYPPGNLSSFLPQLTESERGSLLRKTTRGEWRFATPLHHTYAQILFNVGDATDVAFAAVLTEQISENDREEARVMVAEGSIPEHP